jgi:hypothetical protein
MGERLPDSAVHATEAPFQTETIRPASIENGDKGTRLRSGFPFVISMMLKGGLVTFADDAD